MPAVEEIGLPLSEEDVAFADIGEYLSKLRDELAVIHVSYVVLSLGSDYHLEATAEYGRLLSLNGFWWRLEGGYGLGLTTYPLEWLLYYSRNKCQRFDPTVESVMLRFSPFDWKELDWSQPKRREFLRRGVAAGLGSQGYVAPVRGPDGQLAMLVVNDERSDDAWRHFKTQNKSSIIAHAHEIHQQILRNENVKPTIRLKPLSVQEKMALSLIAAGRTRGQIAYEMGISENTVRMYIDAARRKLGAENTFHAISIGVRRGLIL